MRRFDFGLGEEDYKLRDASGVVAARRTGSSTREQMLSVIITSHDYERYVGEAIASALAQNGRRPR